MTNFKTARDMVTKAPGTGWMDRIPAHRRYEMARKLAKHCRTLDGAQANFIERCADEYMDKLLSEI